MAALTKEDLMALWKSVVDEEFSRPLLTNPDSGIEVIEQMAEQFARASRQIESNRQNWFVRHFSGQTYPPAGGAAYATVDLEVSRTALQQLPIVMMAGRVVFEELEMDYGPEGGELYSTKRRYFPTAPVVFLPGAALQTFTAVAERPGAGYNIPPPYSIIGTVEVAAGTAGDEATVMPGLTQHRLLFGAGDTIPPAAIGQYVTFFAGANAGTFWRVVGYEPPSGTTVPNGAVALAATGVFRISGVTGTFQPGEPIEQGLAAATLLATDGTWMAFDMQQGLFTAGAITGIISGATATVDSIDINPNLTAEVQTAGWQLLGWEQLGFVVTNPESPSGGQTAVLDHIGYERMVGRAPGESDEAYRLRVVKLPDTISPNAILRAANRAVSAYGIQVCLREPGDLTTFPGMFFDTPNMSGPYAYAYDLPQTPQNRYKQRLSHEEMRAFMFITVPRVGLGEFGIGWDEGGVPFYDSAPALSFFDGYPVQMGKLYRAMWDAINQARAGGVGFVILPDQYGCSV